MALFSTMPIGTTVIAAGNFGPVIQGQLGIVVGRSPGRSFPWRQRDYVCTFLGGITVVVPKRFILPHDHGYSLRMLSDPFWFFHTDRAAKPRHPANELRRPAGWHW